MKIYNTLTRQKEEFKPLSSREVKIYYCGPTVYNFVHIWNLKSYVWNDIVVRTLKFLGYNVKTTMNITDIEDKIIKTCNSTWEKREDFTKKYTNYFLEDIQKLGIIKADIIEPITNVIPEMVRMINTMLKRWYAYESEWNIYFEISKFKKYWILANLDFKWMKTSVRVNNDEYEKENASDFVLWKWYKEEDGENFWEEEFGLISPTNSILPKEGEKLENIFQKVILKWRPWWHIECSACAIKHLGPQIDIHMWGIDLIFPHHQNEIAQTESCTWKTFSKYWIHHWHLLVDSKKMSKSLGNFYTLRDLEEKFSNVSKSVLYRAIRLNFINCKYRESVDLSFEKLEANFNTISRIDETLKSLKNYKADKIWVSKEFREYMQDVIWNFTTNLEDDFAIPEALAWFFDFVKFVNSNLRENNFSQEEVQSIVHMFKTFDSVFWIIDFDILEKKEEIPEEILEIFEQRKKAKQEKNFALADSLRDSLLEKGFKIVDSRAGSRVEKV